MESYSCGLYRLGDQLFQICSEEEGNEAQRQDSPSGAMELVMLEPGPEAWLLEFRVSACHLEREDQLNLLQGRASWLVTLSLRVVGLD